MSSQTISQVPDLLTLSFPSNTKTKQVFLLVLRIKNLATVVQKMDNA